MSHALEGTIRLINATAASAGAGDTSRTLRPAAGCVWEILWAFGSQNDGAVWNAWHWTDPDISDQELMGRTATGAGYVLPIASNAETYQLPEWLGCPIATYDRYFTYHFTASAGAKTATVRALVREYRGVSVEA